MWTVHYDKLFDEVWTLCRRSPGDRPSPVVTNQSSAFGVAESRYELNDVTREVGEGVVGGQGRSVTLTVPTEIYGDNKVVLLEGQHLVAPREPELYDCAYMCTACVQSMLVLWVKITTTSLLLMLGKTMGKPQQVYTIHVRVISRGGGADLFK